MKIHTKQGVRFVTGIGYTRDRGHDLLRALGSVFLISHRRQGVRFAAGIGFCVL